MKKETILWIIVSILFLFTFKSIGNVNPTSVNNTVVPINNTISEPLADCSSAFSVFSSHCNSNFYTIIIVSLLILILIGYFWWRKRK